MKICLECEHHKKLHDVSPDGRPMVMVICTHEECRDPVSGDALPANFSRREVAFCGLPARYYKPKEEEKPAPVLELT